MERPRQKLKSSIPTGIALAGITYLVFLAWPGQNWSWNVGSTLEYLGGTLIVVGPIIAGIACLNSQRALQHEELQRFDELLRRNLVQHRGDDVGVIVGVPGRGVAKNNAAKAGSSKAGASKDRAGTSGVTDLGAAHASAANDPAERDGSANDGGSRSKSTTVSALRAVANVAVAFAALHSVVLMAAMIVPISHGAADYGLVALALRHVALIGAYATYGYLVALVVRWRVGALIAAVGAFAGVCALVAAERGELVLAGGQTMVSAWAHIDWRFTLTQVAVVSVVVLLVMLVSVRVRRVAPRLLGLCGLAGMSLVCAFPAAAMAGNTATVNAQTLRLNCAVEQVAGAIEICLSAGSEQWREPIALTAGRVYATLKNLGVETPTRIAEVGSQLGEPFQKVTGDLAGAHGLTLSYDTTIGLADSLSLVDELLIDPRCPAATTDIPAEATAWLYAQLGQDKYPDLSTAVAESPHKDEWLRDTFNTALTCGSTYDQL